MAFPCFPLISQSPPLQLPLHLSSTKPHFRNPIFRPKLTAVIVQSVTFRRRIAELRSKSNDSVEHTFKDENGVVDDMDGYLNSLSLEYDSVWDTKPSWCQPWTIVVTGVSVITCSWLILHSIIATILASSLIFTWWYIFLYSYPKAYEEMISERRKRVRSGVEDTYGWSKDK